MINDIGDRLSFEVVIVAHWQINSSSNNSKCPLREYLLQKNFPVVCALPAIGGRLFLVDHWESTYPRDISSGMCFTSNRWNTISGKALREYLHYRHIYPVVCALPVIGGTLFLVEYWEST